jgi:putative endonuclease
LSAGILECRECRKRNDARAKEEGKKDDQSPLGSTAQLRRMPEKDGSVARISAPNRNAILSGNAAFCLHEIRGARGPLELGARPSPSKGVIPKARVFTSGPRDLPEIHSRGCSSVTDKQEPKGVDRYAMPKQFFVYIMTNGPKAAVLYIGVTGDLIRRVWQHKNKLSPGFTSRYNLTRLVYFEAFSFQDAAIAREKELKGWRRSKKLRLVESMNPRRDDLARDWQDLYKPSRAV